MSRSAMFRAGVAVGRVLLRAHLMVSRSRPRRALATWAEREGLSLERGNSASGEATDGTRLEAWLSIDDEAATLELTTRAVLPKVLVRTHAAWPRTQRVRQLLAVHLEATEGLAQRSSARGIFDARAEDAALPMIVELLERVERAAPPPTLVVVDESTIAIEIRLPTDAEAWSASAAFVRDVAAILAPRTRGPYG